MKFVDPDGELVWFVPALFALVGAYIGGVSSNQGELNPFEWDYKDPLTWTSMIFGGIMGYAGGYWIMNPSAFTLSINISTPLLQAGIGISATTVSTGYGTDWNFDFHWTTDAGGYGNLDLGNPITIEDIVYGSNRYTNYYIGGNVQEPSWNGPYFNGSLDEAIDWLLLSGKTFGVETAMWNTTEGYYFEPIQGFALDPTWNDDLHFAYDYNYNVGFKRNTIESGNRYTPVYLSNGFLYLGYREQKAGPQARVYFFAHTHPNNTMYFSKKDMLFHDVHNIRGMIVGWNRKIFRFSGWRNDGLFW